MNPLLKLFSGLKGQLFVTALIPLVGFAILSGIGYLATTDLKNISETAYTRFIPNSQNLGDLLQSSSGMAYSMWAAYGTFDDEKLQKQYIQQAYKHLDTFRATFEAYEGSEKSEAEQELLQNISDNYDSFTSKSEEIIKLLEQNQPDTREKAIKEIVSGSWAQQNVKNTENITKILTLYKETSSSDREQLFAIQKRSTSLLFIGGTLLAILTLMIMLYMGGRIAKIAVSSSTILQRLGDQVSEAIAQLSSSGQSLSQSSTLTAASLEETVASLEEITSMIKNNSESAIQASTLSNSSMQFADAGEREITELLVSMTDIEAASKKISEIISVIDDIAFQTNLLALNASVEAARAGEHGKGFAVVAEAVRALAQRSAVAAKDINVLIQTTQSQIHKGHSVAQRSGEAMTSIVQAVRKVTTLANEISHSIVQQTDGINQVSKAMNQIDSGTQSNAAAAEEISATVDDIAKTADQMKQQIYELAEYFQGTKNN